MTTRVELHSLATSMAGLLTLGLVTVSSTAPVHAIDCSIELPQKRTGHWSYRFIQGRKCWYQGKNLIPRSELRWREDSYAWQPEPEPVVLLVKKSDNAPVPELCCALPMEDKPDSFEARWRGLDPKADENQRTN